MNKEIVWNKLSYRNIDGGIALFFTGSNHFRLNVSVFKEQIKMHCYTDEATAPLLQKACEAAGCKVSPLYQTLNQVSLALPHANKNEFAAFIHVISGFVSIQSIKNDLFECLGIKAIADKDQFLQELRKLIEMDNYEDARKKVDSVDDETILFEYASLLEEMHKFPEAMDAYQDIDKKNPYYPKAAEKVLGIILSYEENVDLSLDEKNIFWKIKSV